MSLRGIELIFFFYLLFTFALTFLLTLAPPNANDYDSLVYHLAAPQRYLDAGKVIELPYDHHTYFPFLTEMLFTLGLKWSGPVLAKLFHWLMLPLCCLTLIAMGARHFSRRTGLLAACLFASIPLVQIEATTAYVDLALGAFILLAFMSFANWLESREDWWLGWSGVFCGFAMATKYSGAIYLLWILAWAIGALLVKWKTQNGKGTNPKEQVRFGRYVLAFHYFIFGAMLFGGGWYLRNEVWVSNPVYPFAYEIFGGKGWTLEMAKDYSRDQAAFGFGRGVLDWLLLPWRAFMTPLNLGQPFWPLSEIGLQNGAAGRFEVPGHLAQTIIGPALLAFGVPLVFMKCKPQLIGFLLWTFLAFWVFWAATSQQLRYLLPTLALLCLCCGWGVLRLCERGPLLKWTCALALAAWMIFVPAHTVWRMRDVLPVVAGRQAPEEFLTRTFPAYTAMQWANQNTPPNARFAVYGEPRCFYLRRDYFWADDPHNNLIDYSQVTNADALIAALKSQGATHVFWNSAPERNGGFGGPPPYLQEAIAAGKLQSLFEARGYHVYEIR